MAVSTNIGLCDRDINNCGTVQGVRHDKNSTTNSGSTVTKIFYEKLKRVCMGGGGGGGYRPLGISTLVKTAH